MHHVAVLDDVALPLQSHLAGFLRRHLAIEAHVVVIGDDLRADEALLEIGVDRTGGLRAVAPLRMVQARTSSLPVVK
jgi:hypothetical protein